MAGLALGIVSRAIDTAPWAQPWFGLVVLPWLAASWLAGAWLGRGQGDLAWGAAAGFVVLASTVIAYLVVAGDAAADLLPRLSVLAVGAGPAFGAAGAAVHHTGSGRLIAIGALGAALVMQVALLATIGPIRA